VFCKIKSDELSIRLYFKFKVITWISKTLYTIGTINPNYALANVILPKGQLNQ